MTRARQAARPRTGSGPRAPARPRRTRSAASVARASRERAAAGERPGHEPAALDPSPPPAEGGERSIWRLLLDQLDAFLRDPTITRALGASVARLSAAARSFAAALREAAARMARALRQIRIPRRVLLALLALALPLALLALLGSSDDERAGPPRQPAPPASRAGGGLSLPGVGMPRLRAAPDKVPPVSVALVLDRTYDRPALRRELRALGAWLAANHAPGTRVSVIDAASARASGALRAADLADARLLRQRPSTSAAVRAAFARRRERRLLVALGTAATTAPGRARTLRVTPRRGAVSAATGAAAPRRGRSRVTIDERRPNALAASVARAVMAVSGQRERR